MRSLSRLTFFTLAGAVTASGAAAQMSLPVLPHFITKAQPSVGINASIVRLRDFTIVTRYEYLSLL
jgi:hypothetical protein